MPRVDVRGKSYLLAVRAKTKGGGFLLSRDGNKQGRLVCSCPHFIFRVRKEKAGDCKHTEAVAAHLKGGR